MINTNMKKGFTMIELIFVIVIIGILAAVAIPKLAATRDDAKISNIVANARTALGDMTASYTAQGATAFKALTVGAVTNVPFMTACGTLAVAATSIVSTNLLLCDGAVECVEFAIDANASQISVTASNTATSTVCVGAQLDAALQSVAGSVAATAKVHQLGGASVNRN